MKNNRELRSRRAQCLKEARGLSERGGLTSTEQRRFESLMAEANVLKEQIERLEGGHYEIRGGQPDGYLGSSFEQRDDTREREHRAAFVSYLRSGLSAMPPEQRNFLQREFRDMGSGGQGAYPGASAGYFVPVGFVASVIEALKYFGPLLNGDVVDIMDTATGAPLPMPVDNDTTITGERVGENQQVTSQDVNIGQIILGAYKYSSRMVKVSLELMQDSGFALEPYLIRKFAIRLGRILVSDFTIGTGTNMPMGIITATLANGNLVAAVGSSSNDGSSAGTNTLGSDDFVNLEHSVDILYRSGASYMANDSTWKAVRKVKDKFGRPLWEKSLVAGQPDTINGYPMLTNNFMDQLQVTPSSPPVTRNTVLFGDLKRFMVRRVKEMSVLRLEERFADMGQLGFLAFARYDSSPAFGGTGAAFPFAQLQNIY